MILATVAILLGFGLLIGFHEAAHMLVSKLFGVKVNKFAIGFGPILARLRTKETSYELRVLPLGGFVQCDGEDPASRVKRGFFSLAWWKRSLIALAGPIASLLLGYLIMWACLVFGRDWPIWKGAAKAAELCYIVLSETVKFLLGQSKAAPSSSISGPIMIVKILADSFSEGLVRFGSVLSVVSLSLGFFNLLPIPALDGGHVLLYTIEGIRGKKFKPQVYAVWSTIGAFLLGTLMFYTIFSDLVTLWK